MQSFGIIGLEVMGRNIALNIERNGFPIAVYNRTWAKTEDFVTRLAAGKNVRAGRTLAEFVGLLERPRRILLMVKAGAAVDAVLGELLPLLERGDIVIDGGNSFFRDTERRAAAVAGTGIHFFGMGVSGGEEGALWGPSLMPGGDREAYEHLQPVLSKIAAKTEDGPCVTYCGNGAAGHFVKMVHNGIEYGDMQLIAEAYDLLKTLGGLSNRELCDVFEEWNQGELKSFLIEITAKVVDYPDPEPGARLSAAAVRSDEVKAGGDTRAPGPLVELILDSAGQKGTGKWTTQTALDLGVAIPTITAAVDARAMSALKEQRVAAAKVLGGPIPGTGEVENVKAFVEDVRKALYCAKICSYAQGFAMLSAADKEFGYGLNLPEIARIWKAGCIIRAIFLDEIRQAYAEEPGLVNLLLARRFREAIAARQQAWRNTVIQSITGVPLPAFSASLAYYDSYRRERLPANLIQAQRDYFGAHTYQRIDKPGTFHTEWNA